MLRVLIKAFCSRCEEKIGTIGDDYDVYESRDDSWASKHNSQKIRSIFEVKKMLTKEKQAQSNSFRGNGTGAATMKRSLKKLSLKRFGAVMNLSFINASRVSWKRLNC